jgi:hypothetical protein
MCWSNGLLAVAAAAAAVVRPSAAQQEWGGIGKNTWAANDANQCFSWFMMCVERG